MRTDRFASNDDTWRDRTPAPKRTSPQEKYLTVLEVVKRERAPISEALLNHREATNEDALPSFSRFHVQGVTLGSLISELMDSWKDQPFHEERVQIKEFMRGLVSALKLNLIKPLLKAIGGKEAPSMFKTTLENRLKALRAEMQPVLSCIEGEDRKDIKQLSKDLTKAMKRDCKNLNKAMQHLGSQEQHDVKRHLLVQKNVAEAAARLLSLAA